MLERERPLLTEAVDVPLAVAENDAEPVPEGVADPACVPVVDALGEVVWEPDCVPLCVDSSVEEDDELGVALCEIVKVLVCEGVSVDDSVAVPLDVPRCDALDEAVVCCEGD